MKTARTNKYKVNELVYKIHFSKVVSLSSIKQDEPVSMDFLLTNHTIFFIVCKYGLNSNRFGYDDYKRVDNVFIIINKKGVLKFLIKTTDGYLYETAQTKLLYNLYIKKEVNTNDKK